MRPELENAELKNSTSAFAWLFYVSQVDGPVRLPDGKRRSWEWAKGTNGYCLLKYAPNDNAGA